MSTGQDDPKYLPCASLSLLQTLNIFSLFLLLVQHTALAIPAWVLVLPFFVLGGLIYWQNHRIFEAIGEAPRFSRLTDNVPGVREFPGIYSYLLLTLGLLFLPVWTN
jgi:hypothetical protein